MNLAIFIFGLQDVTITVFGTIYISFESAGFLGQSRVTPHAVVVLKTKQIKPYSVVLLFRRWTRLGHVGLGAYISIEETIMKKLSVLTLGVALALGANMFAQDTQDTTTSGTMTSSTTKTKTKHKHHKDSSTVTTTGSTTSTSTQ
jgi:hypothetical protein